MDKPWYKEWFEDLPKTHHERTTMNKHFTLVTQQEKPALKVWGKNYQELFTAGLVGIFQSLKPQAASCSYEEDLFVCERLPNSRYVKLTSLNIERLFIDFLCEALYLSKNHTEAYLGVEFHLLSATEMCATLHGVAVESFGSREIRDVSYDTTALEQDDNGYRALVIMIQ